MSSHSPCYTFHFLSLILTTVLRFGATRISITYGPYFIYKKELCELYMEQKLKTNTNNLFINLNVMKFFDNIEYKTACYKTEINVCSNHAEGYVYDYSWSETVE